MQEFPHQLLGFDRQILVITLPRAVNHQTANPLLAAARTLLPNRDDAALILDCREVSLITSIGIAALLQIQERCSDVRAGMALAGVTPPIRRMLSMLRLDAKFRIEGSVDEAIQALGGGA